MPLVYNSQYKIWLRYNRDNTGEQIQEVINDNGRPCIHLQFLSGKHDGQWLGIDVTNTYNQGRDVEVIYKLKRTGGYYSSQMNDTVQIEPTINVDPSNRYYFGSSYIFRAAQSSIGITPINTEVLVKVSTTGNISNINYPEVSINNGNTWEIKTNFSLTETNPNISSPNRFITIGFGGYSVRQDFYIYEIYINGLMYFPFMQIYKLLLYKDNNYYYQNPDDGTINLIGPIVSYEEFDNYGIENIYNMINVPNIINNNYSILQFYENWNSSSIINSDFSYIPNNQLIKMKDYISTQDFSNIDKITLNQSSLNILNNEIKNINNISSFQPIEYGIDNDLNLSYINKENETEITPLEENYYIKKYSINNIKEKYNNLIQLNTDTNNEYCLLKQDSNYFTINNNILEILQISNLTKQDFENNGFLLSDLNNLDLNNLNNYELLMLTNNLNIELYSTGIYNDPIILKTKNIFNQNIQKINSILFNYTKHLDLNVKILTSFNNEDWLYYNPLTNDWELQDINNITNQNTKEELELKFNNLTYTDQFLNELYFQFIIDQTNDLSHNFKLNSINIDFINDSQLKIIFSNEDDKWYGYDFNNNEQVLIDINYDIEIFNYGLNISQFNDLHNLNPTFWNQFQGGTNKIKFQFYLSINDTQEIIELDTLTLQVDINGTWKLQQVYNPTTQTGDYDLELSDKMIRVNVYSNGSYKVNYNFIDETPPNDLISFDLIQWFYNENPQVKINWVPPTNYDYKDSVIMRKQNSYPNDIYDGQRINPILPEDSEFIIKTENDNEIIDQKNIEQENTYYYRQFPFDIRYNYNDNLTNNSKSIYIYPIPTDGLIAYYPLMNDQNDYSGNGNHGTAYGGVTFTGNYQDFDGVNDYINVGDNFDIGLNDRQFSLSVKFDEVSNLKFIFSKSYQEQAGGRFWLHALDGKLRYVIDFSSGETQILSNQIMQPNINYHIVVNVVRNSSMRLYINGILDGETQISSYKNVNLNTQYNFRIGCYTQQNGIDPTYFFNGKISNLRIYNRQLTENEIQTLYNYDRMI